MSVYHLIDKYIRAYDIFELKYIRALINNKVKVKQGVPLVLSVAHKIYKRFRRTSNIRDGPVMV